MKNIYFFVLLSFFLLTEKTKAQSTITDAFGPSVTFIQGISPVNDVITVVPSGTQDGVTFYATNTAQDIIYDSLSPIGSSFTWTKDIGSLPPGTVIWASTTQAGTFVDNTTVLTLNILPSPAWLSSGSATGVTVNGTVVSFQGNYPVASYNNTIDPSVIGIGNRPLNIVGTFVFGASYDMSNLSAGGTVDSADAQIALNLFDQVNYTKNVVLNQYASITLSDSLNIHATIADSIQTPVINLKSPRMTFPVTTGVTIGVDAGLSLYGTLYGQVVLGEDNSGSWGFVNDQTYGPSKLVGVLTGNGFIRGNVDVLYGLANATATLNARARLGAGFTYTSTPSMVTPLFGGDLDVSGTVDYSLGWGFLGSGTIGPQEFYYSRFGDTTALHEQAIHSFESVFGSSSVTFQTNGTVDLPPFNPQPAFGTQGNKLYGVWVDSLNGAGYLLFSKLNATGTAFSPAKVVISNQNSIVDPHVAILPDSSAIITWAQSSYDNTTFPSGDSLTDVAASESIWVAFYDFASDSIFYVASVSDGGRSDGNPQIAVGAAGEALITFVSKDLTDNISAVYYSHITESQGNWTVSAAGPINSPAGTDYEIHVAYYDSVQAIAVWINDPDNNPETLNSDLYYSTWDGTNGTWTNHMALTGPNPGYIDYKQLSLASNDPYIALAFTGSSVDTNNSFVNTIELDVYDNAAQNWITPNLSDANSTTYYQTPRVSISDNGIASICYQAIDMFNDTAYINPGELHIFLNNIPNQSGWKEITGVDTISLICDTSNFIWHLSTGFGNGNNFYTLTQEYGQNGIVTNPSNGILFGDHGLSMVLRGLVVNPDLTVGPLDTVPTTPTGLRNNNISSLAWFKTYPNPFSEQAILQFQLTEQASVQLQVLDITGKTISTLINTSLAPGIYNTEFNAGNLPSGFYIARLLLDNNTSIVRKMIIAK